MMKQAAKAALHEQHRPPESTAYTVYRRRPTPSRGAALSQNVIELAIRMKETRCISCNKLLLKGIYTQIELKCPRCKTVQAHHGHTPEPTQPV